MTNVLSAAIPSNLSEKPQTEQMNLGSVSQEDRCIFNNYIETNKQLKFDNMSSCSLMLSKSGASSALPLKDVHMKRYQTNDVGDKT